MGKCFNLPFLVLKADTTLTWSLLLNTIMFAMYVVKVSHRTIPVPTLCTQGRTAELTSLDKGNTYAHLLVHIIMLVRKGDYKRKVSCDRRE